MAQSLSTLTPKPVILPPTLPNTPNEMPPVNVWSVETWVQLAEAIPRSSNTPAMKAPTKRRSTNETKKALERAR